MQSLCLLSLSLFLSPGPWQGKQPNVSPYAARVLGYVTSHLHGKMERPRICDLNITTYRTPIRFQHLWISTSEKPKLKARRFTLQIALKSNLTTSTLEPGQRAQAVVTAATATATTTTAQEHSLLYSIPLLAFTSTYLRDSLFGATFHLRTAVFHTTLLETKVSATAIENDTKRRHKKEKAQAQRKEKEPKRQPPVPSRLYAFGIILSPKPSLIMIGSSCSCTNTSSPNPHAMQRKGKIKGQ